MSREIGSYYNTERCHTLHSIWR